MDDLPTVGLSKRSTSKREAHHYRYISENLAQLATKVAGYYYGALVVFACEATALSELILSPITRSGLGWNIAVNTSPNFSVAIFANIPVRAANA